MKYLVKVNFRIQFDQRTLQYQELYITDVPDLKFVSLDEDVEIFEVVTTQITSEDHKVLSRLQVAWDAYPGKGNYFDINGEEIGEYESMILNARYQE